MTADKIPDDIKVLIVIHPKAASDALQYALDQFVLRGGKLVAFVDPLCILDRPPNDNGMPPHKRTRDAPEKNLYSQKIIQGLGHHLQKRQSGDRRRTSGTFAGRTESNCP